MAATAVISAPRRPPSHLVNSSTSITATSPAEAAGTVDVTVTGRAPAPAPRPGPTSSPTPTPPGSTASPDHGRPRRARLRRGLRPGHGPDDPVRRLNSGAYYNDTWAWNGSTWTQLAHRRLHQPEQPARSPPMAYDPATPPAAPVRWLQRHHLLQRHLGLERHDLDPGRRHRRRRLHHDLHDQPFGPRLAVHGLRPAPTGPAGPVRRLQRHRPTTTPGPGTARAWAQLTPGHQPARPLRRLAMAYDPANRRPAGPVRRLQRHQPAQRHLDLERHHLGPASPRPPARRPRDCTMAYDPANRPAAPVRRLQQRHHLLHDTWDWTGTTWASLLRPANPRPQQLAMAYDAATNQMVLFGGLTAATTQRHLDHRRPQRHRGQPGLRPDRRGHLCHHHRHRLHRNATGSRHASAPRRQASYRARPPRSPPSPRPRRPARSTSP